MASSNFLIVFVSSTLAPGRCVFVPKIQPVLWHLCYDHLLLFVCKTPSGNASTISLSSLRKLRIHWIPPGCIIPGPNFNRL
ncbi:hypothetical protein C8Q78DRAFT_1054465, partial [Trametes maxima]